MAEAKNLKEANEIIAALEAKSTEQSATISEQETVIAELRGQLTATKKEVKKSKVIVKHEGSQYEVVIPQFSFNGEVVTAEDLKSKPEVVAALVVEESSVLQVIV